MPEYDQAHLSACRKAVPECIICSSYFQLEEHEPDPAIVRAEETRMFRAEGR